MDDNLNRLVAALRSGARRQPDLLRELGISQSSFSRLVARAGDAVVTLGRARATSYALGRDLRGLGSKIPIYRVTREGVVQPWRELRVLSAWQYGLDTSDRKGGQFFEGLPFFLQDMRPQGFLGRAFPRANGDLGLPERLVDWSDDDALFALAKRGEDCIGDMIVGDESLDRFYRSLASPMAPLMPEDRSVHYVELARQAMAGTPPASSAGGEQPKFTTVVLRPDGEVESVLVKFSPMDETAVGTRWRDLLISEHHALEAIRASGFDAPRSSLVLAEGRVFLEVARFDRVGAAGRLGVLSLGAIDDEFFGKRDNWIKAASRMEAARLLSPSDARALRFQTVFGQLIGNTDQHFGNVSLIDATEQAGVQFHLAPAYDVLPMLYAPVNGEIVPRTFVPRTPTADVTDVWNDALLAAEQYWRRLTQELRLSDGFRETASMNAAALHRLAATARISVPLTPTATPEP